MSPSRQRDEIEAWVRREDATLLGIIEDLDAKGWKHRPELDRIVTAVETGGADGIVVAKLDRYFRDQLGGHATMRRIKEAKGFLAIPGDGIDTRHEAGKMMFGFLLTIAEGEIDRFRSIFADARKRAVARGIHPCPVPPAGYTREEDPDGHVIGPLEPHPEHGRLITDVFTRASSGESWAALARSLDQNNVPTAYGNTWTARAVKAMVRNRVYLGEARHGEFANPEAHEPLTDELTFRRAQREGRRWPPPRSDRPALLSGLLRCAGCQYGMASYFARGRREYKCHRIYPAGRCPQPAYVIAPAIEPWVEEQFLSRLGDIAEAAHVDTSELVEIERDANRAQAALEAFRDDPRVIEALGHDGFVAGLRARQSQWDEAQDRLSEARGKLEQLGGVDPIEIRTAWPRLSVLNQRRLLGAGIDAVFLRRGRSRHDGFDGFAHICWRGEAPITVPTRGRKRALEIVPFAFPRELGENVAPLGRD